MKLMATFRNFANAPKNDYRIFVSIKPGIFVDWLRSYQVFKKHSASYTHLVSGHQASQSLIVTNQE